jgi:hypothetical protein
MCAWFEKPLTHLCLQECDPIAKWAISSALHWVIALSDTRWSSCKPMVLVTLGGCHLLDGLVVVFVEACKEDCAVLRRSDCEGYCAHPAGATNSNSSRARCEGWQVVWPCQVLELVVSTPRGRVWLVGHYYQENRRQPWSLSQRGLDWWQPSEPRDKNHRVIIFLLVCNPHTQACIYFHILCACVVALVIS